MNSASLRFPIPYSLYAQYSTENPDLFDAIALTPFVGHFCLYCAPDEYKPIEQDLGSTEVTIGYSSPNIIPTAKIYGLEISTVESRPAAYEVLRSLNRAAVAIVGVYTPLTVWDAHHIHEREGTVQAFDGIRYCERRMRLQSLTPQGGSIVEGATRYSTGGFTVRLMELEPRNVY